MGKLSKRVKFIAAERRLSMPAEFLHAHGIERGDSIHVAVRGGSLFAFPSKAMEGYRNLGRQLAFLFPEVRHPFFTLFEDVVSVSLGSQDRVVLPREFPYHPRGTIRLHWEMVDGFLHLQAEAEKETEALPAPRLQGQISMMDFLPAGGTPARQPATSPPTPRHAFDRRAAELEVVEKVALESIDLRDRSYADKSPIPPEGLLRSVRLEGVRKPVLLHRSDDGRLQIVDGFRRIQSARQIKLTHIPALVWQGLSHQDCLRLKLTEGGGEEAGEAPTLKRLRSTLKLHEGQVDIQEIEKITGRRKRTLQRYLRVAADPVLREAIEKGRLSIFKAEEILKAGVDPEAAVRKKMSVKEIRSQGRKPAPTRRPRKRAVTRRRAPRGTTTVG